MQERPSEKIYEYPWEEKLLKVNSQTAQLDQELLDALDTKEKIRDSCGRVVLQKTALKEMGEWNFCKGIIAELKGGGWKDDSKILQVSFTDGENIFFYPETGERIWTQLDR